ncbi:MAG: hypothetical protein K2X34_05655, partial [Hyphomonadaceae bacterium]|nr:hypothetical protein [Hyphomonadaceae bacterium]
QAHRMRALAVAAVLAVGFGASDASAQRNALIGYWECTGQANGLTFFSTFDYRPDGTYVSTQRISEGTDFIEGGGGGSWRYEGGILHDTKEYATLERFVRNGMVVPRSDPEWQALYAQSQSNLGTTTSGPIDLRGDTARSGMYTCLRGGR